MKDHLLIYGATGYMGQLLAEYVSRLDDGRSGWNERMPVILAARNDKKLAEVAREFDLPYRSFALESPRERAERLERDRREPLHTRPTRHGARVSASLPNEENFREESPNALVDAALGDVRVVLNAAGPFSQTALPLLLACLRTGTHYVDISGEYDVIDFLHRCDHLPGSSVVMPGAGLTVLASDLLIRRAVLRAHAMGMSEPHAVRVALSRVPFVSRGSVKTMLDSVRDGIRTLRNGKAEFVAAGALVRSFGFAPQDGDFDTEDLRLCTAMTLADLLTAGRTAMRAYHHHDTGRQTVPNVETYVEASSLERAAYEVGGELALALRTRPIERLLSRALDVFPEGPLPDERVQAGQQVVVEVEDRYRRGLHVRLALENSYDFTVRAALEAAWVVSRIDPVLKSPKIVSPGWVSGVELLDNLLKEYPVHVTLRGLPARWCHGVGSAPPRTSSPLPSTFGEL